MGHFQFPNYWPNHWHVTTKETVCWWFRTTAGLKRTGCWRSWKSGSLQPNPLQSRVWDGDLRYERMGARNRADLRTARWGWGRANKQNMMGPDQLACVRAITQKRANGSVVTGMWCVWQQKEKMEQRVRLHMFNKRERERPPRWQRKAPKYLSIEITVSLGTFYPPE